MFGHNRPGKGSVNRACAQNDSPGGSTSVKCDIYLAFCLPSHFSTVAVGSTKSPKRMSTDSWNRFSQTGCLPVAQPTTSKQC